MEDVGRGYSVGVRILIASHMHQQNRSPASVLVGPSLAALGPTLFNPSLR